MEIEEAPLQRASNNVVMATTTNQASVAIHLHPLVVMNISEHWTRVRAQENQSRQVIGALIGKQTGRKIEVMNSFELIYSKDTESDEIIINTEYYYTKAEQFKQVFKDLDFLGWYTTGGPPNESDIKIHHQMCLITDSPIILKLNPAAPTTDLPITVYESVIDIGAEAQMRLVQLSYTLATEEAERIGVDHVARVSNVESGSASSSAADHLESQYSSISMLYTRVRFLSKYIQVSPLIGHTHAHSMANNTVMHTDIEVKFASPYSSQLRILCFRLLEKENFHIIMKLHGKFMLFAAVYLYWTLDYYRKNFLINTMMSH